MGTVIAAFGGPDIPQALVYGVAVIPAGLCLGAAGFAWLAAKDSSALLSIGI